MKICRKCREAKHESEFPKQPRMADGLSSWCKPCKYAAQKEWRLRNSDRCKSANRSYYEQNKHRHNELGKSWKRRNHEKVKGYNARYQQKLKQSCLDAYGGVCSCEGCDESKSAFLTIDHINGDGKEHRKTFTQNFYKWLSDNGYPDGFRTLCFNCNIARHWNGGICPHIS